MRVAVFAATTLLAIGGSAAAADLAQPIYKGPMPPPVMGWTGFYIGLNAGGGIEVALAPNWSARLEYLYLNFGKVSTTWVLPGLPAITDNARFDMNVVRAGVNYRF